MALESPTGGANRTFVWQDDGSGNADTLLIAFKKNESSEIVGHPLLQAIQLNLANKKRDQAFETFLQGNLSRVNLQPGEQIYEDGTSDALINTPSGASKMHIAHLDGLIDGKYKLTYFYGVLIPDTGNSTRTGGSLGDTPVSFAAIPATGTMTLGTAELTTAASDVILGTTAATFTTGEYGTTIFYDAA